MAIFENSSIMHRNVQRDKKEMERKEREREREQRDGYNKLRREEGITNGWKRIVTSIWMDGAGQN